MLCCYLSDTALSPMITDRAIASYTDLNGMENQGVCQINERVLSVFNTEFASKDENGNDVPAQYNDESQPLYPNVILDARLRNTGSRGNVTDPTGGRYINRLVGLFDDPALADPEKTATNTTGTERAVGDMALHYDFYRAATSADAGNMVHTLDFGHNVVKTELQYLFNIIEYVVYSHRYESGIGWSYKSTSELETILLSNVANTGKGSTTKRQGGYIAGSLIVPTFNPSRDKWARVKNVANSTTGPIKTVIGETSSEAVASDSARGQVFFPDYIQFMFRFSELDAATIFKIYLNPAVFVERYNLCTITHVICPTDPDELLDLTAADVLTALATSSKYVAKLSTTEITKTKTTDITTILRTANITGALDLNVDYVVMDETSELTKYNMAFTCLYKGRKPTVAEMRRAIRKLFADREEEAKAVLPDLYVVNSYVLVPQYDTRVTLDTTLNTNYCLNIVDYLQILKNYNGWVDSFVFTHDTVFDANKAYYIKTDEADRTKYIVAEVEPGAVVPADTYYEHTRDNTYVPEEVRSYCTILNVPAYYMYVIAYPLDIIENEDSAQALPDEIIPFDQIAEFLSYQPIGSTDAYWGTLSDTAREFNEKLTKLIASQINNMAPVDVDYTVETLSLFNVSRSYLAFTVGGYSFSLMTKESYSNHEDN